MTEKAIAAVSGLPTFFADAISSYRASVAESDVMSVICLES